MSKFTAHDEDSVEAHFSCLERPVSRLEAPHGCIGGYVFIGHLVVEDGRRGKRDYRVCAV